MTFARVKPSGWTDNVDPITSTQINALDVNVSNAVDGTGGGTYTGPITLTNLTIDSGNSVILSSRSITRIMPNHAFYTSAGGWDANTRLGWVQSSSAKNLVVPLRVPHDAILNYATVYLDGATYGTLPSAMPAWEINKITLSSGAVTSLATATDTSATVGAFGASHAITNASDINERIDRTLYRYALVFTGEGDASYVAGSEFVGCSVTYTCARYDED